ncbi:MAG TPA: N-acetyl-gamma-glutamyl-phosphate reductase [Phycisphaerales bacterium]|nr:N-acetyl-gamma-glutamyl-phosphate reductase [Phycisphaerales bacterium]
MQFIPIAIVGASGYSGAELISILLGHPNARIVGLFGSGKSEKAGGAAPNLADSFPRFRGLLDLPIAASEPEAIKATGARAVFLCTPHEASMELAPALVERGLVVLDLSAAFRLKDAGAYDAFYGFAHTQRGLLERAVYGMPELFRERIANAALVAVPGCYPTSAILPLAPLANAGAIRPGTRPIIDATSGASGAGRKAEQRLLFAEVSQQAYGVLKHRHQPEIDAYAGVRTVFTPHLGPYERGILATIHVELAQRWTGERARGVLTQIYAASRFVRLCPPGVWPAVNDVRGTNFCDIALASDDAAGHLVICSAIDNLTKGAAGQAVQCMNIRFGLDEATGLLAKGAGA